MNEIKNLKFMTNKEQAIELRNQFRLFVGTSFDEDDTPINNYKISKGDALICAKIAVQLIKNEFEPIQFIHPEVENFLEQKLKYWTEIFEELNKF